MLTRAGWFFRSVFVGMLIRGCASWCGYRAT
jgi:hypothetical protein